MVTRIIGVVKTNNPNTHLNNPNNHLNNTNIPSNPNNPSHVLNCCHVFNNEVDVVAQQTRLGRKSVRAYVYVHEYVYVSAYVYMRVCVFVTRVIRNV